jgi:hypothetical protein
MTIDPRCVNLIKDLEQCQRTPDGRLDKKDESLSHMLDSCSYYIAYHHGLIKRQPMSVEW